MSSIGPQFYEFIKKLDENGGKLPTSITSRTFQPEFEFNNSTCNLCNGYYGPSFGEPVCATCHEFLYPDIPHHLPNSYIFSEKTEDGDSGNDEPSVGELMYNDRRLTRALQQQGIPNWAFRCQNSLDSEASPEDLLDLFNQPSHSRLNAGGPNGGEPSNPTGNPNRAGVNYVDPDRVGSNYVGPHRNGPNGSNHNREGFNEGGAIANRSVADFSGPNRDDANSGDPNRDDPGVGDPNRDDPGVGDPNRRGANYGDPIRDGFNEDVANHGSPRRDDHNINDFNRDVPDVGDPNRRGADYGGPNGNEPNRHFIGDDPDRDGPEIGDPNRRVVNYGGPHRDGPNVGEPNRDFNDGDSNRDGPNCGNPNRHGANYGGPIVGEHNRGGLNNNNLYYGFPYHGYGGARPAYDDGQGPAVPDDGYPRPLPSCLSRSLAALSTPRLPDNLAPGLVEQLPSEVLLCMFSYLDDLSLCACALVCVRWLRLVRARVAQPRWAAFATRRWPLFRPMVNIQDWHKKYQSLVESCFCRNCVVQMCMQSQPPFEENAWRRNRLRNEIKMLRNTPPEGCAATPLDPKCCHWQAMVTGPVGSPYEGGVFYLYIQVPYSYPMSPPVVRFLTRILHPNVSRHGDVGIDSVHHNWSLALTISKLLISIQSLLTDPYTAVCMEPEVGDMYVNERVRFERIARRWTWRYAMHDLYCIY